jgi:hypothetical protein
MPYYRHPKMRFAYKNNKNPCGGQFYFLYFCEGCKPVFSEAAKRVPIKAID